MLLTACSLKFTKHSKKYFENKEKIIYVIDHLGSRFYLVDIGKDGKIDKIYKNGKELPPIEAKKYKYLVNYINLK